MNTPSSIPRTLVLCLALALLAPGCITYSRDEAIARMSAEEKSMLDRLSRISKSMTKAEVRDILGPPDESEAKDTWRYGMNPKVINGTLTTYNSPLTLSTVKHGQFTGGTTTLPGSVVTTSYGGETIYESMGRVFFKNDRVMRVHFVHPGMDDKAFAFDVLK